MVGSGCGCVVGGGGGGEGGGLWYCGRRMSRAPAIIYLRALTVFIVSPLPKRVES